MYRVYDPWTSIVHVSCNIQVDELNIYSHEAGYDYTDKEWAPEDNTLLAPEAEAEDSDNKEVSTSK